MKDTLQLLHPALGMLGVIAAIWVIVETMNASPHNQNRIRIASFVVAVLIFLTWITAGYLYVYYYPADKAIILKGPWTFAHSFFMESKEHLFFMTLILSFLLPVVTRMKNIAESKQTRLLIISVAGLIVISGLAIELAGAVIALGKELGLMQHAV